MLFDLSKCHRRHIGLKSKINVPILYRERYTSTSNLNIVFHQHLVSEHTEQMICIIVCMI